MLDEQKTNVEPDVPVQPDVPEQPAAQRTTRRTTRTRTAKTSPAAETRETHETHEVAASEPQTVNPTPPAQPEEPRPEAADTHEQSGPHLSSFAPKGKKRATTRRKTEVHPPAEEAPEPSPKQSAQEQPAQEPRKQTRRTTRKPAVAEESAQETLPVPASTPEVVSADPIGEALNALGRSRRVRTRTPRVEAEEPGADEALLGLAQAIATSEGEEEESEPGTPARRRRRRRGGRKRRRDVAGEDQDETEDVEDEESEPTDIEEETLTEDGATHRRRRRRRRGEDTEEPGEEQADVVVKVREPRPTKAKATTVTGIDGSTRLEAKKQRRREGRAASRRRAPILSEAEFLARRESVERKMLIRQKEEYSQIAVVEDGILVEHYVDRASAASLIGNIYLGKVQNVLPGMEAAFIDIGRGRNAVLYAGEVDWDSFGEKGENRKIEDVFTSGQLTVVQVSKDPVGAKGARLTSHISIPGRYVVYAPKGHISGISRKLSESERNRLKSILDSLVEETASVVIRTAAEGASEEELVRDVNRLKAQWEVIEKKAGGKQVPQLLYAEPDLTMKIVRDLFTEDFTSLVVDGNGGMEDAFDTVGAYVAHVAPHLADRIERWDRNEKGDLFAQYRIDEQIAKALDRKVHLPSGGSLVIDRTEAMTVIDVNTGKFTGSGGNLEATVTSNNLEAAEEIVRQLRLRDIGGIIIIDFIDMVLPSNRELLLRRLVECLGRDRTRHQVSEVTSLGLVQLTRKKVGTGLAEAFTKTCEVCDGMGHIRFDEPVQTQAPADGGERHPVRRGRRKSS